MQTIHPRLPLSTRALVTIGIVAALVALLLIALVFLKPSNDSPFGNVSLLVLLPAAFLVGVLSFVSPCTLPILPGYFAFSFQAQRSSIVGMTFSFFFGLATTMTLLGASATALGQLLQKNLQQLTVIGGIVIILFGIMSLLGKGFTGAQIQERPATTILGSYLFGATFALGWTACLGPILGAILTLLSTQGVGVVQGALLAFVYALGLGLPLIIVSVFFSRLGPGSRVWQILRGRGVTIPIGAHTLYLHSTSILSGVLLIIVGFLLASGQLAALTTQWAAGDLSQWVIETEIRLNSFLGLQ